MNHRLEQFMKAEKLTSAKFAEILSVQPSSISHLISGRNKPNFDFIAKLLLMFPQLNPRWVINGQGDMYISENRSLITEDNVNIYDHQPTDIFSFKNDENINQQAEPQEYQSVTNVNQTIESVQENSEPSDGLSDIHFDAANNGVVNDNLNSNKSDRYPVSNDPIKRNVEQVLLLYNDNTFEFFSNLKR